MFAWSRLEIGMSVLLAGLILIGGTVQWWFGAKDGVRTVIVEAKEAMGGQEGPATSVEPADSGEEAQPVSTGAVVDGGSAAPGDKGESSEGGTAIPGAAPGGTANGSTAAEEAGSVVDERININTAQPSELQRLPGIGPALAQRIVEYRELWGPFHEIEDIMEVSGIGPVKFANMKHLIKVR